MKRNIDALALVAATWVAGLLVCGALICAALGIGGGTA